MSAIIEGNKRTTSYDLASGDIAGNHLWSNEGTTRIAGTTLITKNGSEWSQWETQKSLGLLGYICQQQLHSNFQELTEKEL